MWAAVQGQERAVATLRAAAEHLGLPPSYVYGVATFYTMFNLAPVGKVHVQLCGTTPCRLRGADDLEHVCRKRIGDLRADVADKSRRQRTLLEALGQRLAGEVLHHQEHRTLVLADVVERADVRVVQRRGRAGFAPEPIKGVPVAGQIGGQELEGHAPAQPGVLGLVNNTHTAAANTAAAATDLGSCGVKTVYAADGAVYDEYLIQPHVDTLAALVDQGHPIGDVANLPWPRLESFVAALLEIAAAAQQRRSQHGEDGRTRRGRSDSGQCCPP